MYGTDKKENFLPLAETAACMRLPSSLLGLSVLLLGFPLASAATIYKWTDEHGTTVYSNRAPAAEAKVSNVQVALEDERPAAAAPQPANPNELQQRIRSLEQQVQSLQSPPPAYAPPQQPPPVSYYPPADYYPQQPYYPTDNSSMYGYGDPYAYGYPYYPYYPSYIVVTGRRFVRPVHPIHPGFVGRPGVQPVTAGARSMPVSGVMGAVSSRR